MLLGPDRRPLYWPTLFVLTELRARNRAANTISQALRAVGLLMTFLDGSRIDLEARIAEGRLLTLSEVDRLARVSRLPLETSGGSLKAGLEGRGRRSGRLQVLAPRPDTLAEVLPETASNRLRIVRDYVGWFVMARLCPAKVRGDLRNEVERFLGLINSRLPPVRGRQGTPREGIGPDCRSTLLSVIEPDSPQNPWVDSHSKARNQVIVELLDSHGIRRGELLGLVVEDIDFRKRELTVHRRPDNPLDPRRQQPTTKTRARILPLSAELADMLRAYIINHRSALPGARKHRFLFVSSRDGAPLTVSGLVRVYRTLRERVPDLPRNLSPHLLRHTWNDRYSEEMERNKTPEALEQKTRSYLMGWSDTSGTAAAYTRRYVRKRAHEVSLELQKKLLKGNRDD